MFFLDWVFRDWIGTQSENHPYHARPLRNIHTITFPMLSTWGTSSRTGLTELAFGFDRWSPDWSARRMRLKAASMKSNRLTIIWSCARTSWNLKTRNSLSSAKTFKVRQEASRDLSGKATNWRMCGEVFMRKWFKLTGNARFKKVQNDVTFSVYWKFLYRT